MLRKFWWGSKDGERKPSWVSWKEMCKPKNLGGLGFRDIELFNLALLARQGCRLLQNPGSLSARILKGKVLSKLGSAVVYGWIYSFSSVEIDLGWTGGVKARIDQENWHGRTN
jgi:hypothetical protein